jgi:hypothetical protein
MSAVIRSILCFFSFACLFIDTSYAKSENTFSTWIVEPPKITPEPLTLKRGEFLQRARLLPIGLIELTADIHFGANGENVIHAGEQLFELAGGTIYQPLQATAGVFCQIKTFDVMVKGLFGGSLVQNRYCFVDRERDGQLDNLAVAGSCPYDLPLVSVKVPDSPPTLTASIYRRVPITDFRDGPMVGIAFDGIQALDGDPRFIQAFGSGNPIPLFGEKHSRAGDSAGQRVSFGAAFTILRAEGQTVTIRNDRPIPFQPFGIFRSGPCRPN